MSQRARGRRHTDSQVNDDLVWLTGLRALPPDALLASWARATAAWPGWKLVAMARRMRALGLPVVMHAHVVRVLAARCVCGGSASTWAALPNLERTAGVPQSLPRPVYAEASSRAWSG